MLCVDACEDRNAPRFPLQQDGKLVSTYGIIKKCAEAFLLNKSAMNPDHQFAILILKANTQSMSNFDNKVANLIKTLHTTQPQAPPENPMELGRIFKLINEKIFDEDDSEHPLPLRVIILYGRSGTCVVEENVLSECQNVITDILFIHRPILSGKENKRITSNLTALQSCLSEKSLCGVALSDSFLAFKHVMRFLLHPALRE